MMISDLKEALQDKNEAIRKLEDEVDNIQGRICRKTLIFQGVPEGAKGSQGWLSCKRYLEKYLSRTLDMSKPLQSKGLTGLLPKEISSEIPQDLSMQHF